MSEWHKRNGTHGGQRNHAEPGPYHVTLPPSYKKEKMTAEDINELKDFQIGGSGGGGSIQSHRRQDSGEFPYEEELEQLRKENELLRSGTDNLMAFQVVQHGQELSRIRKERNDFRKQLKEALRANERLMKSESAKGGVGGGGGSGHGQLDPEKEALRKDLEKTKEKLIRLEDIYEKEKSSPASQPSLKSFSGEKERVDPTLMQRVEELGIEVAKLKESKAELLKVNQQWDSQYQRMKNQTTMRIQDLMEEIDKLKDQLEVSNKGGDREHQRVLAGLETRLRDAERELEESKRRARHELDTMKRNWEKERQEKEIEVKELSSANQEWEHHYARLKADSEISTRDLKTVVNDLNDQLNKALDQQTDVKRNEVGQLRQQLTFKERDLAETNEEKRELQGMVERKARELEGVTAKWEHCKMLLDKEQEHGAELEHELRGLLSQRSRTSSSASRTSFGGSDGAELRRQLHSLETANGVLKEQIQQYEDDFLRERRDKDDYVRKMREQRDRASRLEQRILTLTANRAKEEEEVGPFGRETIDEQHQAWRQFEQAKAAAAAADPANYNVQ